MDISSYETQEVCRFCGEALEQILDLGNLYVSNFINPDEPDGIKAPLVLCKCSVCGLVQLGHTVNMDSMYRQYWYKSSLNSSMVRDLENVVTGVLGHIPLAEGDIVLDIGCNDGTMFRFYPDFLTKIGVDPALNLRGTAEKYCNEFINDYFSAEKLESLKGKISVITAIAMFYDLPDINTFVNDVKELLTPEGIFVIQFTDLLSMFKTMAFDNICHEHLEYYSLDVLQKIFNWHEMDIFDVEYNKVNGGSIRAYVCKRNAYPIKDSVYLSLGKELSFMNSLGVNPFEVFNRNVKIIADRVTRFLDINKDKEVCGLGASTKGNTLLQYLNLPPNTLSCIADINEDKFWKLTVGTRIPIVAEDVVLSEPPDYFLVLTWHFAENLINKPAIYNYLKKGGVLIFPMPLPYTVSYRNGGIFYDPIF